MKEKFLSFLFCTIVFTAKSQEASVEKSLFGIQTGFLGIWINNESRLSNQIALRSEVGLEAGMWGGTFYEKKGFIMNPVVTLEPRWYYNLNRRVCNSKRIDGNSGNFIALKTSYRPDLFVISNYDIQKVVSDLTIIPTWGIRRNIGNRFNYETGVGIGYTYMFAKQAGYLQNESEVALKLHLRIGYRF